MRIAVRLSVALLAFGLNAPASARAPDAVTAPLEAAIQAEVRQGFSGTVLVARGGNILLLRGYGSVGGVPMRGTTRYWISSMGKQFVSAAVMALHDQGRLDLDAPIRRWIPDAPADKAGLTLRQILSHQSGLPQGYVGEGAETNAEAVRGIMAVPLAAAPGQRFIYSNDNYQLAAAIVERASGLTYRDFITRHFLARFGMRDSGVADGSRDRIAPTRETVPPRLLRPNWGIEGHYASAPDLLRWYRALASGRAVRSTSWRTLTAPARRIGEGETALGWFLSATPRGTRRLWTRGNDDYGPNSLLYAYPERDLVIIVLSHAGQRTEDLSQSRAMLAALEQALAL